jgi:TPR repeat protein
MEIYGSKSTSYSQKPPDALVTSASLTTGSNDVDIFNKHRAEVLDFLDYAHRHPEKAVELYSIFDGFYSSDLLPKKLFTSFCLLCADTHGVNLVKRELAFKIGSMYQSGDYPSISVNYSKAGHYLKLAVQCGCKYSASAVMRLHGGLSVSDQVTLLKGFLAEKCTFDLESLIVDALNGSSETAYQVGLFYQAHSFQSDALKFFQIAVDKEHPEALCELAVLHLEGSVLIIKSESTAETLLNKAIQSGSERALRVLGNMYLSRCLDYVTKHPEQAEVFLTAFQTSEWQHLPEQFYVCFKHICLDLKIQTEAIREFKFKIGTMYRDGIMDSSVDNMSACFYFKNAYKSGCPRSGRAITELHSKLTGVARTNVFEFCFNLFTNQDENLLEDSLNKDSKTATNSAYVVGQICKSLGHHCEALKYFQIAADNEHGAALFELGKLLFEGSIEIKKDEALGEIYLNHAANLGFSNASQFLDAIYSEGRGSDIFKLAFFVNGEINEDPALTYQLALLYDKGKIVAKDPDEALRLYAKAASAGHVDAQIRLNIQLYERQLEDSGNIGLVKEKK